MISPKIGIITLTNGENYGNQLQNYAVQEVLKKIGFFPETIVNSTFNGFNVKRSFLSKFSLFYIYSFIIYKIRLKFLIKNDRDKTIKSIFWKYRYNKNIKETLTQRRNKFDSFFNSHITTSLTKISINHIPNNLKIYDFFVCGSDQVWNPNYINTSMIDFLCFAPEHKRIAYSPSFGVSTIPKCKKNDYKKWISQIPNLSVREKQGAKIIKALNGRDATVLVDPTLMLSKDEWLSISKKPSLNIKRPFILTYFLGNETTTYQKTITNFANSYSFKIINLNDSRELTSYTIDPAEFIYLINKAALVCTDSFHGIIFSIIMNSNFIVFDRVERGASLGSRIENLLTLFGLEDRRFKNIKTQNDTLNTRFDGISKIIKFEQYKTWMFLMNATGKSVQQNLS